MRIALRIAALAAFLSLSALSKAQIQIIPCPPPNNTSVDAGQDQTICPGQCANLSASAAGTLPSTATYAVDSVPYTSDPYTSGTQYNVVNDDTYGPVVTLPFPFCFFGNKYTQCVIGTNGQVCFNTGLANTGSGYVINTPLPTSNVGYNNCIMGPTHDLYLNDGGVIRTAVYGVAPCRRFVVSWDSVAYFTNVQCPGNFAIQQIVLFESTYEIGVNIRRKELCTGWNNGNAILGIQNATGTVAYTAPGKNATNWSVNDKSYRFVPNGTSTGAASYTWKDGAGNTIGTGANVTVCPTATTTYTVTARIVSGCDTFYSSDDVTVTVFNPVTAAFTYDINYGCSGDTVHFTNLSTGGVSYQWSFGDGSGDTTKSPTHIYNSQGIFTVQLIANSLTCKDTIEQQVDLVHPLIASFTVDDDSVCQGQTVSFTNTSTTTTRLGIDPTWYWEFGDGGSSTMQNPTHTYTRPGVYNVMMVVKDFVPCFDTAWHTVVVDSIPYVKFTVSDSSVCDGNAITFYADYLAIGNTGISWEFGDNTGINDHDTISHAYDTSGKYYITLTASYRICPDTSYTDSITIRPFPSVNLGPDTTICLNGEPVVLTATTVPPGLNAAWSTGELSQQILIRHHGIFFAKVDLEDCIAYDTVEVRKDCYTDVPNVFSPNGDGNNDYFFPRQFLSRSVKKFNMQVFNRWGQLVFETTNAGGRGWDGKFNDKEQPTGVYVYLIEVEFTNSASEKYQGNVTLLR